MDEVGFVFIDLVGVVINLGLILIVLAMLMWFGWAVGGALGNSLGSENDSEDSWGFFGVLVALAFGIYMVFFA